MTDEKPETAPEPAPLPPAYEVTTSEPESRSATFQGGPLDGEPVTMTAPILDAIQVGDTQYKYVAKSNVYKAQ